MNKRVALAAAALAVFAVPALHAAEDENPSRYGFRLLSYAPSDGDLREDTKSTWFGPGLDWYIERDEDELPTRIATLGYVSSGDDLVLRARICPLTYTKISRTPISASRNRYVGYGAGIYLLRLRQFDVSSTSFKPGVHGMYGQEFGGNYFAEVRLDLVPSFENYSWSGVSLNIGTRVSL